MSYLHIINGNGDQRLGRITHKTADRGAVTADITASGSSTYSRVIKGPSGLFTSSRTSINPTAGAYHGVNTLRY